MRGQAIAQWINASLFDPRILNPLKPEFTIVIFIHYKPRIAVAIVVDKYDLMWVKNSRKLSCIGKPVLWKFSF